MWYIIKFFLYVYFFVVIFDFWMEFFCYIFYNYFNANKFATLRTCFPRKLLSGVLFFLFIILGKYSLRNIQNFLLTAKKDFFLMFSCFQVCYSCIETAYGVNFFKLLSSFPFKGSSSFSTFTIFFDIQYSWNSKIHSVLSRMLIWFFRGAIYVMSIHKDSNLC